MLKTLICNSKTDTKEDRNVSLAGRKNWGAGRVSGRAAGAPLLNRLPVVSAVPNRLPVASALLNQLPVFSALVCLEACSLSWKSCLFLNEHNGTLKDTSRI